MMNEKYLHLIWKSKRLPFHQLKTTCGKQISILDIGTYNLASGPDFFNGKIEVDQVKYSGNIELHVKSSDWFLHGHQFDNAYNNVILHVVFEHDKDVILNDSNLLTIELENFIDWKHFNYVNTDHYFQKSIPCINSFELANSIQIWSQFQSSLVKRIERKLIVMNELNNLVQDIKKVLFIKIAKTFGMKINELPFEELALSIPLNKWLNLSLNEKMVLAFGVAGLEDNLSSKAKLEWAFLKHKYELTSSNTLSWKFKGLRHFGYPTNRLSQFVVFCHLFKWDFTFFNQDVKSMKDELYAILKSQSKLEFDSLFCKPIYTEIKKDMIDLIIINSFVPFFVYFQKFQGKEMSIENGVQLLEQINPEKNKLINFWKELGVKFNTAADSQSALEQYNELCSKKKCMDCQISSVIFQQKP
jgi:hypothetical protein